MQETISQGAFAREAARPGHNDWNRMTARRMPLYHRDPDIRSEFGRDQTRILHSRSYSRLKSKTQVFYDIDNDHICTRMEHVGQVASVSGTIAKWLGLNDELTSAIALGHDIGHAPFGHLGESILCDLSERYLGKKFWHEQNGLRVVDSIETLPDHTGVRRNLNLTFAVRDGIASHCGEVAAGGLRPRDISIDPSEFACPAQYEPATWEGCVVKVSDKIAYLGRDIQDAIALGFLSDDKRRELDSMASSGGKVLNTTVIISDFVADICSHSTPETGICMSEEKRQLLDDLKRFNYENIYRHERLEAFGAYARIVLEMIFSVLIKHYRGAGTFAQLAHAKDGSKSLTDSFAGWLAFYSSPDIVPEEFVTEKVAHSANEKIYGMLESERVYARAVLDYMSGMTDRFAVRLFNELLTY